MAKFSCSLFIVAALLGGTAADVNCIMTKMMPINPELFLSSPDRACRDVEGRFRRARQELQKCLNFEIDLDVLEYLHEEFCATDSDFRKKVDRQRTCLLRNILKAVDCFDGPPRILPEDSNRSSVGDFCLGLALDMTKCLGQKVGGPCGEEGLEVYSRIAVSSTPFLFGTCMSVIKIGQGESEVIEEVAEAENKAVESYMAEGKSDHHYGVMAAAADHPVLWWILIGLPLLAIGL